MNAPDSIRVVGGKSAHLLLVLEDTQDGGMAIDVASPSGKIPRSDLTRWLRLLADELDAGNGREVPS